jgi:hypothetical protein
MVSLIYTLLSNKSNARVNVMKQVTDLEVNDKIYDEWLEVNFIVTSWDWVLYQNKLYKRHYGREEGKDYCQPLNPIMPQTFLKVVDE